MGQPVEQRTGEALGAEGLRPFVEGQVAGDQGRANRPFRAIVSASPRKLEAVPSCATRKAE